MLTRLSVSFIFLSLVSWGAFLVKMHRDPTIKSVETYWRETGLNSRDIEEYVNTTNCHQSVKHFKSCVMAVKAIAEKKNKSLLFSREGIAISLSGKALQVDVHAEQNQLQRIFIARKHDYPFQEALRTLLAGSRSQESYLVGAGINAYLGSFYDPHTYIVPVDMYEKVINPADNNSYGLGIAVKKSGDSYYIGQVYAGSPADHAGLTRGYQLIAINGKVLANLNVTDIRKLLTGKKSDSAELIVVNQGLAQKITLRYENIEIPGVESHLIEKAKGTLGHVVIRKFAYGICDKVKAAVHSLLATGAQGIMLDLRDNQGGPLDEVGCVAELFLQKGQMIFEARYSMREFGSDFYYAKQDPIYQGPLVVLTNASSASSSEILAGTLQDNKRAIVVGERTFGKGSFQKGRIWEKNPKVAIFETQGLYYLPSGRTAQVVGITPDVPVKSFDSDSLREADMYAEPLVADMNKKSQGATSVSMFKSLCAMTSISQMTQASLFETAISSDNQISEAEKALGCLRAGVNL